MKQVDQDWLQRLRDVLAYDPETGEFLWKVWRGAKAKAGSKAGTIDSKGHRQIRFEMKLYLAHRLAWVITHGCWPTRELDHINRNRADNRLANLRDCSHAQNGKNCSIYSSNTSGHSGVSWCQRARKWKAYITYNGRRRNLGSFAEKEGAIDARAKAARELFGEFSAQHGVTFHDGKEEGEAG